ncbi:hypothetical protein [Burkholderia pyrrocinia]|nr:hypothetical protein [Burkholderia pyrrocinia]
MGSQRHATGTALDALVRLGAEVYRPCGQNLYLWAALCLICTGM